MKYREIGKSGIEISVIALGAWALGGDGWWEQGGSDEEAVRTIRAAIDHGINIIDTAPVYGRGHSEELVGKAIADISRDKVVISTKCGVVWDGSEGSFSYSLDGFDYYRNLTGKSIRNEVEQSLKRLKTDYIDILFTHRQALEDFPTLASETMGEMLRLKEEGKIRAVGVSNCTVERMKEYVAAGQLDAAQPPYSMLNREIEGEYVDYCVDNNISVFAYSPLEQGLLTGKIGMDYQPKKGTYKEARIEYYRPENRRKVLDLLDGFKALTEKYSCTMAQLAIAWTVAQKGITTALCGARREKNIIENAAAGAIEIDAADLRQMRDSIEAVQFDMRLSSRMV